MEAVHRSVFDFACDSGKSVSYWPTLREACVEARRLLMRDPEMARVIVERNNGKHWRFEWDPKHGVIRKFACDRHGNRTGA